MLLQAIHDIIGNSIAFFFRQPHAKSAHKFARASERECNGEAQTYGVLNVTNPSAVLYKLVTVWPLSSAVTCFQRISSPHALTLTEAAPGVHPAKVTHQ